MKNPYLSFIEEYSAVIDSASKIPLGNIAPISLDPTNDKSPVVLLFSPHPDDEGITGALALRLRRKNNCRVINVAVTQGSKKARQAGRWNELKNACKYLGLETIQTIENGLEKVTPYTRENDKEGWNQKLDCIANIITKYQPKMVVFPHENDWNGTHIGTHYLIIDALAKLDYECLVAETEFWGAMDDPNFMLESSKQDVADLISSISFHLEEVARNPYHISLPAWMSDNVRRGAEIVGGQGRAVPDYTFATLYRISKYSQGQFSPIFENGELCSQSEDLAQKINLI